MFTQSTCPKRLPRSGTICTSFTREGQKDLDQKFEEKIMSRILDEPALRRLKEKGAKLEHFKVDQTAVTVVEEKPLEEKMMKKKPRVTSNEKKGNDDL